MIEKTKKPKKISQDAKKNNSEESGQIGKILCENNDFLRALCPMLRSIRDEKSLLDASHKKILRELETQSVELREVVKVNRALEELNLELEREAKNFDSKIRVREKAIDSIKSKFFEMDLILKIIFI